MKYPKFTEDINIFCLNKGDTFKLNGNLYQFVSNYEGIDRCVAYRKSKPVLLLQTHVVKVRPSYFENKKN